jgi:hypothetical protein
VTTLGRVAGAGTAEASAASSASDSLAELRTSARGWHGVQLAVLGFIGLCGALNDGGGAGIPGWLQQLTAVLVLVALALACIATVLVASAAWPVYGSSRRQVSDEEELHVSGRRLRGGIVLTFLAVVVLGLATSSSWWPGESGGEASDTAGLVELSTAGGSVCGTLLESDPGTVAVHSSGQRIVVPVGEVVSLDPTGAC